MIQGDVTVTPADASTVRVVVLGASTGMGVSALPHQRKTGMNPLLKSPSPHTADSTKTKFTFTFAPLPSPENGAGGRASGATGGPAMVQQNDVPVPGTCR